MNLNPLALALQGIGFGASLESLQGLLNITSPTGGSGSTKSRPIGQPWHWVPFNPVHPRRPKKRRDADLLFL